MVDINEIEKAYLAGLIDGEGCITITRYKGKNNKSPVYSMAVIIGMGYNSKELLCYLRDKTGLGTIHIRKNKNPKYQATVRWSIQSSEAVELLKEIQPYLLLKLSQAELAIEFQTSFGNLAGNNGYSGWVVPDEEIQRRDSYYKRLQGLKKEFVKIIAFDKY